MINSWIFFALNAKPTSMRRAVAERLAEKEPVVIVDCPVSVIRSRSVPSLKFRSKRLPGEALSWHYRPLHYPERLPGIGKIAMALNRRRLQRELEQLVPQGARRIVIYDSPTQDHLVGRLGEDVSVYLAIDDRTVTVWGDPIVGELDAEKRLLAKVDKVICVSEVLAQTLRSRMPEGRVIPVHVLPNGYDERLFDPQKTWGEPAILAGVPKPRILVAGHVSERIDWEGIRGATKARPNWTWVFVGPADPGMKEKIMSKLDGNGFCFPPVQVEEVPAWIQHSDACAVPYRLNDFTRSSSPLKGIEYLAMGAPVLSTRVPSLERYVDSIQWVEEGDGKSYARALDELAANGKDPACIQARCMAVSADSWAVKIGQFREMLCNVSF